MRNVLRPRSQAIFAGPRNEAKACAISRSDAQGSMRAEAAHEHGSLLVTSKLIL